MKPTLSPQFDNTKSEKVKMLFVDDLLPNPYEPQSRRDMPKEEAHEGWLSLERAGGIIHYLRARPSKEHNKLFQVGDGWRRRCWSSYGYHEQHQDKYAYVPCIVKDYTDREMADMIPEANGQRKDMNDIQWGEFYKKCLDDFGGTQEALAGRFKKSQEEISNTMRLLHLPTEIRAMIISCEITPSHGRALLALRDPALMLEYAAKAKGVGWSVAALDEAIKFRLGKQEPAIIEPPAPVISPAAPAQDIVEKKQAAPIMAGMPVAPEKPLVEEKNGQPGSAADYIVCHFCEAGAHLNADGGLPRGWEKKTYEEGGFYACPDHTDEPFCRVCGCSEWAPCSGGCYWVEDDLCSSCDKSGKEEIEETEWETIHVDEEIFNALAASYSADKIGGAGPVKNRMIKKPVEYKGKKYVCVGTLSESKETELIWCHEVVPLADYKGKLYPEPFKKDGQFYSGVKVQQGGIDYVLSGPQVTFRLAKKVIAAAPTSVIDKPCRRRLLIIEEYETFTTLRYSAADLVVVKQEFKLSDGLKFDIVVSGASSLVEKIERERDPVKPQTGVALKKELGIPESVRLCQEVPDSECQKCDLGPTDHTVGRRFSRQEKGIGLVTYKVCLKDWAALGKKTQVEKAEEFDETKQINIPFKMLEEIYRTNIIGQIKPGAKKSAIKDIKWFEYGSSRYVCTGQSWEPRDGGKDSAFCFRIVPRQEFTGKLRDYYDGENQKNGYFYDRIPVSAPNGEFVLLGPEVIFYAIRNTPATVPSKINIVLNPSPKEYVLNHTYRITTKEHHFSPDITAQDLPAAIKTLKINPTEITEVKVWKSSGKPSTSGAKTTAGWGKCSEPIPAAVSPAAAVNKFTKSIRCLQCHEIQHMEFEKQEGPELSPREHWMGICPDCKQPNFIENARWDKMMDAEKAGKADA